MSVSKMSGKAFIIKFGNAYMLFLVQLNSAKNMGSDNTCPVMVTIYGWRNCARG